MASHMLNIALDERITHMKETKGHAFRVIMDLGKIADKLTKDGSGEVDEQVEKMTDSAMRLAAVYQTLGNQKTALSDIKEQVRGAGRLAQDNAHSEVDAFEKRVGELEQNNNTPAQRRRSKLFDQNATTVFRKRLREDEPAESEGDDDDLVVQSGVSASARLLSWAMYIATVWHRPLLLLS